MKPEDIDRETRAKIVEMMSKGEPLRVISEAVGIGHDDLLHFCSLYSTERVDETALMQHLRHAGMLTREAAQSGKLAAAIRKKVEDDIERDRLAGKERDVLQFSKEQIAQIKSLDWINFTCFLNFVREGDSKRTLERLLEDLLGDEERARQRNDGD